MRSRYGSFCCLAYSKLEYILVCRLVEIIQLEREHLMVWERAMFVSLCLPEGNGDLLSKCRGWW